MIYLPVVFYKGWNLICDTCTAVKNNYLLCILPLYTYCHSASLQIWKSGIEDENPYISNTFP